MSEYNRVTLIVPKELVQEAKTKALREGISLSALVRKWLRAWVGMEGEAEHPPGEPKKR